MQFSKPMQWVKINSIAFTFPARKNDNCERHHNNNDMHGN